MWKGAELFSGEINGSYKKRICPKVNHMGYLLPRALKEIKDINDAGIQCRGGSADLHN
jgi:hypothetical protein